MTETMDIQCDMDPEESPRWKIVPLILDYLTIPDLKKVRLVSKDCLKLVHTRSKFVDKVMFEINGFRIPFTNLGILDECIQHLAQTPQRWTRFKFVNLDLEGVFLGREAYFDPFVTNHCSAIKSLHLVNCVIRLGRLMELLAFCKVLVDLEIRNCDKLFDVGQEIGNWSAFVPHCARCLSRIRYFSLEGSDFYSLHAFNLNSLLRMPHIVKLELKNTNKTYPLPIDYICTYLRHASVQKSLKHLSLIGSKSCELTTKHCACLWALDLHTLSLAYFRFMDPLNFSHFISAQKNLRKLKLHRITLRPPCFYKISTLNNLKYVILSECRVDENSSACLGSLARAMSIRKLDLIVGNDVDAEIYWGPLFDTPFQHPNLRELNIYMKNAEAVLPGIAENWNNLTTLRLIGAERLFGNMLSLKYVFQITTLKRLSLANSGISNDSFTTGNPRLGTLADLQNLEYLNLSFNEIDDYVILKHVVQLSNLRELVIAGTKVTCNGLYNLKTERNKTNCLRNLRKITATQCSEIQLNVTEFAKLCFTFTPIRLELD